MNRKMPSASTSETYRSCALEHLERADYLFRDESYFLCHYLAGLAIECHLRARIRRTTDTFNSRHDLALLAVEALLYDIVTPSEQPTFAAVLTTVNRRWRSNHRFYSERQFLDYMNEIRAEYNVRGERWRNLARTMLNHAHAIIKQGEAKW